jgi:hypothetical protein
VHESVVCPRSGSRTHEQGAGHPAVSVIVLDEVGNKRYAVGVRPGANPIPAVYRGVLLERSLVPAIGEDETRVPIAPAPVGGRDLKRSFVAVVPLLVGDKLQPGRDGPYRRRVAGGAVVDRHPTNGLVCLYRKPPRTREPRLLTGRPRVCKQAPSRGRVGGGGVSELVMHVSGERDRVHRVRVVDLTADLYPRIRVRSPGAQYRKGERELEGEEQGAACAREPSPYPSIYRQHCSHGPPRWFLRHAILGTRHRPGQPERVRESRGRPSSAPPSYQSERTGSHTHGQKHRGGEQYYGLRSAAFGKSDGNGTATVPDATCMT